MTLRMMVVCLLLAAQSAAAAPKLAVPWIEAGPEDDEDAEFLAARLTHALRAQVHADERYDLPTDDRTLAQVKRHTKCDAVKTACLVVTAKELGGDVMIFGRFERNVLDGVEGYAVSLELITVAGRTRKAWNARAPLDSIPAWIASNAPKAYAELAGKPRLPSSAYAVSRARPPAGGCDSDQHELDGDGHAAHGRHAAALRAYELAVHCRFDRRVAALAFVAACNAKNETKALQYYAWLPEGMDRLRDRCIAMGVQIP